MTQVHPNKNLRGMKNVKKELKIYFCKYNEHRCCGQ